jgi:hypothetical protein
MHCSVGGPCACGGRRRTSSPRGLSASRHLKLPESRAPDRRSTTHLACRRGKVGKATWSRVEPRFRGSTSCVEAGTGFRCGSSDGAAPFAPVWQGSEWSRGWSRSWSPAKQGLSVQQNMLGYSAFFYTICFLATCQTIGWFPDG